MHSFSPQFRFATRLAFMVAHLMTRATLGEMFPDVARIRHDHNSAQGRAHRSETMAGAALGMGSMLQPLPE